MNTAVYPGTFDPIHNGHVDIATRAARLFDYLIFAVYARSSRAVFPAAERVRLAQQALAHLPNIEVCAYEILTAQFAAEHRAAAIVRGLRVGDFDYELQMALTNRLLAANVETVCLMASAENVAISGTLVRDVASLGGDVSRMVPEHVAAALRERFRRGER